VKYLSVHLYEDHSLHFGCLYLHDEADVLGIPVVSSNSQTVIDDDVIFILWTEIWRAGGFYQSEGSYYVYKQI
jgi:hypothetical protein